ncbi:putative quinol monooxygenase [Shewanella sp. 30m-9]
MSKVILKGFILVPQPELAAIKNELVNHKRLTLKEEGCLLFEVTQSRDNRCRFDVHEEFVDKCSFEHHQARVRSSYWGKLTVNVERHY